MAWSKEAIAAAEKAWFSCAITADGETHWRAALDAAAAIDGDYNAGVEDAAKYLEDDYGYAVAAEIRKLKKAPRP